MKQKQPQARLSPLIPMYFDKRFSSSLHFTEDDLEANRHGYLNTGQARRKIWHYFSQSWLSTVFFIPVFLFSGIATYAITFAFGMSLISAFAPTAIEQVLRPFPERLLMSAIFGALWLYIVWLWGRFFIRAILNLLDLRTGIVDYCVGEIAIQRGGKYDTTVLIVDNTRYRFPTSAIKKLEKQLKHDKQYILYYLPKSRTIVSAEPLETR